MAAVDLTDLKQRAREQRERGDLGSALRTIGKAIDLAGAELADLHGTLGGALRQQGDLAGAASAYDTGFHLDQQFHALSSFNALNRLVTRVLLEPGSLSDPNLLRTRENLEFLDVCQELIELQKQLESDVEERRAGDYWCAGDLVVSAALNGDLGIALEALKRFDACSPPAFARDAYHTTLATLAQLETPRREILAKVDALLS